jgi:hypothetical protein
MNSSGDYPGSHAASPPQSIYRTTRPTRGGGDSLNDYDGPRSVLLRRGNDDIEYARAATYHDSYRRGELSHRNNDDIIDQPRRSSSNFESYGVMNNSTGFGLTGTRRAYNEPRPNCLTLEALNSKKHIQTYLVEFSNMTDKDQRLAQGATRVTPDGRYYLLSKDEWVSYARENPTDLRSERYQLLTRQVNAVKAGATTQIAVLNLKTDAKLMALRAEHDTANERNTVAMGNYENEMYERDERDVAQTRAEESRLVQQAGGTEPSSATPPVRASRTRALAVRDPAPDTISASPAAANSRATRSGSPPS